MRTFQDFLTNKGIWLSLGIIVLVSFIARGLVASEPSPQELAAEDIPVQQQIKKDTYGCHIEYVEADKKLAQNIECVKDAN